MEEITISGEKKYLKQVEEFANKLGLSITFSDDKKGRAEEKRKNAYEALKKLREMNVFSDINDPVEWQRQIRKDRDIGRKE